MPVPPGQPVLECSIELLEVLPRVWRRLLVPASVRLDKLHRMFQAAMGWPDRHLHAFEIGGERYGMQFDEYPDEELDERSVTVVSAVGTNQRFRYEYDFGDSWEHEVTVHGVRRMPIGLRFAVCLDGAMACPPEDSGGPGGYEDLLRVLSFANRFSRRRSWRPAPSDGPSSRVAPGLPEAPPGPRRPARPAC